MEAVNDLWPARSPKKVQDLRRGEFSSELLLPDGRWQVILFFRERKKVKRSHGKKSAENHL
jgi:hypothetical protein